MITIMKGMPDDVLGITADGEITGTDYETVLIPALEEKLKNHEKIKMLYHLGSDFTGFDMSALIDDAKVGMKHLSAWDKIALVSDSSLINTFAKFFGYMMSCELRVYKNAELEAAKSWIISK